MTMNAKEAGKLSSAIEKKKTKLLFRTQRHKYVAPVPLSGLSPKLSSSHTHKPNQSKTKPKQYQNQNQTKPNQTKPRPKQHQSNTKATLN
jgi:hypothetical protein